VINLSEIGQYASEQGDSEHGDEVPDQDNIQDCNEVAVSNVYDESSTFQTLYDVFADLCSGVPMDQVLGPQVSSKVCDMSAHRHPIIDVSESLPGIYNQPRLQPVQRQCECCGSFRVTNGE
jgi:hypothetical protein